MDVLVPNTEGCTLFERHRFKKDKCKNCGLRWQEHRGVIDDSVLQGFLEEQRAADVRRHDLEEKRKAESRAKALAKKKQARSVEDDWLFGGDGNDDDCESDDGLGFQMLEGTSAPARPAASAADSGKQPKVVNLIDFGECNLAETPAAAPAVVAAPTVLPAAAPAAVPAVRTELPAEPPSQAVDDGMAAVNDGISASSSALVSALGRTNGHSLEEELLAEIEHLRQRLQDSDAERSVQISIVQDEVFEKQRTIEELQQRGAEVEALYQQALKEVEAMRVERDRAASVAEAARAAAARCKEDPEPLRPLVPQEDVDRVTSKPSDGMEVERRTNLAKKLLDTRHWLKCLRPTDESDHEEE
mmetsp:Transcript_13929/g.32666  ORF Transcript_13929/g.32666 Transcript_13929/m.32666 type:complete len:358 (-) Transcript_13929:91-1164(-)